MKKPLPDPCPDLIVTTAGSALLTISSVERLAFDSEGDVKAVDELESLAVRGLPPKNSPTFCSLMLK
jgi:hypothetical protein